MLENDEARDTIRAPRGISREVESRRLDSKKVSDIARSAFEFGWPIDYKRQGRCRSARRDNHEEACPIA